MKWASDAEKYISRVPFFVRRRVKKRVEEEAKRRGSSTVTLEHVTSVQKRFLKNMESEIRGFRVETCFGQGGCKNRAVAHDGLAQELEVLLASKNMLEFLRSKVQGPLKMHNEFKVTISDCPNACSRPQISDIGVIGAALPSLSADRCTFCGECEAVCKEGAVVMDSREGPMFDMDKCLYCGECIRACPADALEPEVTGYRVLVGGRLGRHPKLAHELPGIYSPRQVKALVESCVELYKSECESGERFGEVLEKTGTELLMEKAFGSKD